MSIARRGVFVVLASMAASVAAGAAELPAFPGAEGFGASAVGGRGGRVIEVTTLADDGPGSLREALAADGPRIVVFRVGGTIELKSELVLASPFVTIAGQTAPGGGVTLKTHRSNHRSALTIASTAHDVVIRHLRSRPGPHDGFPKTAAGDAPDTSEVKDALQILGAKRVIIDHCSFSWATDEVVSTFFDAQDVTIQWCVIAEGLRKSRPDQQLPGKGLLIGSKGGGRVSVHHNLLVHNVGRNPLVKTAGLVDVVNNVVMAPEAVAMAVDCSVGPSPANFVGNIVALPNYGRYRHLEGPMPPALIVTRGDDYSLFVEGNRYLGSPGVETPYERDLFVGPNNGGRSFLVDRRHAAPRVTTSPPDEVVSQVLDGAGCTRPERDAVDLRLVDDVRRLCSRVVDRPEDVGGWPELATGSPDADGDRDGMPDPWERRHGLDPTDEGDGRRDADGDGYTNVEEFLNETEPQRAESAAGR